MLTTPRIDHDLIRRVREARARPGWTSPLERFRVVPAQPQQGRGA